MKKILYSLLTLAAALTVASCQKEPANPDPIYGGKTVETTFTVALDQLPTKTYADGTTADKLFVLVYGADGLVASQSKTTADDAIQINNLKASYTVKFVKGQKYDIVFWAQAEDAPFSIDLTTGKLTIANSGPANAENRDAFWYVQNDYEAKANDSETVTLKRPFAQINVLLADEFEEGTLSEMTVENAPSVLDLLTGETSENVKYSFTEAGLEDATFNGKTYASQKPYAYAGMNYVLMPKDETVSAAVTFKVTCKNEDLGTIEIEKSLTGVPLKRNYRTNITYSPTTSKDYKIIVSPTWDGTNDNISADAQANEFDVIVGGSEFENGATLELALNESKTVTVKDANDMAPETAESEDPDVVTVTPTNEAGTYDVAAVAEGTANVNFHIDNYTKQDVQGADFTIVVKVGDGIKKDEQSIAWSAETATAKIDAENTFPTLDKTNAKGEISYASSNTAAATINAETGVIALVAAGTTTITATAAAITVDGVQYAEATASYELTVSEADAPAMKDVTITVTEPANKALSVEENKTASITASAKTADNETVAIVYTSGDTSVATVDNSGVVTGVAEGSTKITLTTTATDVLNAAEPVEISVTVTAAVPPTPTAGTIADIKAAIGDATASKTFDAITLGAVTVTGVNGKQVYMEDETGGIILYLDSHGLTRGKSYTGAVVTKGYIYKGAYEIEDFNISDATVADADLPSTTVAVSGVNFATYESRRIKLEGVTFGAEVNTAKQTVSVTQGNDAINVYVIPQASVAASSVADVYGVVTLYNNAVQVSVLDVSDIQVKSSGKLTATISGMADKNLEPGESFDFKTVVTTNSTATTITYSIVSGDNVVTLSNGVVTVKTGATVGATAVIKAAVAENDAYTAAEATATITVKDASSTAPDPEEIVFANWTPALENGVQYLDPFDGGNFTITFAGGGNDGKYYTTGAGVRTYGGGSITIESSYSIAKIEFTWASGAEYKPSSADVVNTGSFNDDFTVWTGDATKVVLTRPSGSGHWRLSAVKVTYK